VLSKLIGTQRNTWGYVSVKPGLDMGSKPQEPSVNMFLPSSGIQNNGTGFLGDIPSVLYTPDNTLEYYSNSMTFDLRPYFEPIETAGDFSEVTQAILNVTYGNLDNISKLPLTDLTES